MQQLTINVNDEIFNVNIEPRWTLMKVIRDVLGLKGTKCGCATNDCGACKVLVDGEPKNSCAILAKNCEGKKLLLLKV